MTKPSDAKFHYVEGVFRLEKHAMVSVERQSCAFCAVEANLPTPAEISYAIEVGRDSITPFGDNEGDYWPEDWILLRDSSSCAAPMCPACFDKLPTPWRKRL